ncbi:DoxX family protein (plasmid) [Rhodococcus gordoniae]|nr:DoxX family protein [Rhodococcus gordoniae]UTT51136.1 DoxX family protein [Rhodococcus gordoniae]
MLVLRVALGGMLIAHGANKIFGGGGLTGTAGWFESLGLRPGRLHAALAACTEIGAGALLLLGFLTPAASAAYIGLMLVAALTDHRGKGYFVFKGGWEYTLLVGMVAVVPAIVGPGRWSLDHVLGLKLFGIGWAGGCLVAGVLAVAGLMSVFYRPQTTVS